jgi:hypothetical protein
VPVRVDRLSRRVKRARWRAWENVGLRPTMELDELVLNWIDRRVVDLDVRGAVTGVELEVSIEGAPTVNLTLRDPDGRILSEAAKRVRPKQARKARKRQRGADPVAVDAGWEPIHSTSLIGRALDLTLDGVTFRLVGVRYSTATGEAELTFEHRLVYWLRRKRGARRANRKNITRAQFILSLVRDVHAMRYRFVCPELDVRQRIGKGTSSRGIRSSLGVTTTAAGQATQVPRALTRTYPRHRSGAPGAARLTERAVRAAAELAGLSPTDALHAAQIARGESGLYPGVVQDDPGDGNVGHGLWQMTPNAWGGSSSPTYRHMRSLGGIAAMRNPLQAARQMAWMFRQSGNSWRQWYGVRYLDLSSRAHGSVLGPGMEADLIATGEGGAAGGSYRKSYQFTRNADEDSWTAIQRLAGEVGWRAFVVGNSFYYMSETALYGRRPRYEIVPDHPAVVELSYDVDWGKPVSECELEVVLGRWDAPPGSVVLIEGYGIPDGRWLVSSLRRDYFSPVATVTLRQPSRAKMEPAPETGTRGGSSGTLGWSEGEAGGKGKAGRLYAEAKRISDAGGPYVYGGGHGPALSSLASGQGLDCSSSVSLALRRAGLFSGTRSWVSGDFAARYGVPGRGEEFTVWANSGHVWIEFNGLGPGKRFDTSPYGSGSHGPRVRGTDRPTSGFTPRHWPGL